MSVSRFAAGLRSLLPPPMVSTRWSWAGGSSTLADSSRSSLFRRPGTSVMVLAS